MKILLTGDPRAAGMIHKKPDPDKNYRPFEYTCTFSKDGTYLIRNTLTGAAAELSAAEWSFLENCREQPANGAKLKELGFEPLAEHCFLIDDTIDGYALYQQVVSIIKTMSREEAGTKTYTILPTTGCNARCIYCYEQGLAVKTMSEETADRVAEFINETRWQDQVSLIWFGGEPLAGSRIITRICRSLEEKAIPFKSKIITNATMLTPELLEEAISCWHLESAQVSVDGERKDYEARKMYADPSVYHYDAMMAAVGSMLEKGLKVVLRCNYDAGNFEGLKAFIDDVKLHFGNTDLLSVYLAMLFQTQSVENGVELYRKAQELNAYLRKLGLKGEAKPHHLKLNLCGADSGDKSVVITPEGKLYHCEHLPGNTEFGSVYDREIRVTSDPRAELPADEKCRNCCFLPECTPFYRNGCSDYFECCKEYKQIDAEEAFRRLM